MEDDRAIPWITVDNLKTRRECMYIFNEHDKHTQSVYCSNIQLNN